MRCIACDEVLRNSKYDICYKCVEATVETERQPFIAEMEVTEVYEEYN